MAKKDRFFGFLEGERIYLREVRVEDVNEAYYRWMNDSSINQFLESRFFPHTLETLRDYVSKKMGDESSVFLAIVLKKGHRHIGNIKIGPINTAHRIADIGILLGEKDCWGKGYATEAVRLLVGYAFDTLNLHKVTAGCYAPNKGSIKAFKKVGFVEEGLRKQHCYCGGEYVDDVLLGLCRTDWKR
ncbi:MAG: GNAT family protein [Elusimicrobiota bacterium]|jgi:RimJ/RimL family protein N-acetyltransferase